MMPVLPCFIKIGTLRGWHWGGRGQEDCVAIAFACVQNQQAKGNWKLRQGGHWTYFYFPEHFCNWISLSLQKTDEDLLGTLKVIGCLWKVPSLCSISALWSLHGGMGSFLVPQRSRPAAALLNGLTEHCGTVSGTWQWALCTKILSIERVFAKAVREVQRGVLFLSHPSPKLREPKGAEVTVCSQGRVGTGYGRWGAPGLAEKLCESLTFLGSNTVHLASCDSHVCVSSRSCLACSLATSKVSDCFVFYCCFVLFYGGKYTYITESSTAAISMSRSESSKFFTWLCNYHNHLFPELSLFPDWKSEPLALQGWAYVTLVWDVWRLPGDTFLKAPRKTWFQTYRLLKLVSYCAHVHSPLPQWLWLWVSV